MSEYDKVSTSQLYRDLARAEEFYSFANERNDEQAMKYHKSTIDALRKVINERNKNV